MATSMLTQCVVPVVGGMLAEQYYLSDSWLCSASSVLPSLPRAYFLVVLVNAVVSSVLVVFQGFAVGVKRSDCIAKAKKDGDEHAEERYAYPKLYAEGFSKVAREFNCYQRSHQQAYETYPQFLVLSMLGGITFPITTAVFGAFWCYSRKVWAEGYRKGDPKLRYEHWASKGIWYGLIAQIFTSVGFAAMLLLK